MRVANIPIFSSQSLGANATSSAQTLDQAFGFSVQAQWTGASAAGTLKLQASLDGTNWDDISGASTTIAGAGNILWNVTDVMFPWVRVVFTRTSGTGSLSTRLFYRSI